MGKLSKGRWLIPQTNYFSQVSLIQGFFLSFRCFQVANHEHTGMATAWLTNGFDENKNKFRTPWRKEKKISKCPFLTLMIYWRGSRSGFVYHTFILFLRKCLYIIVPSGKGGITLGKRRVWPVCKETYVTFGVGFKTGEEIIFTLYVWVRIAYSEIDFTVH